MLFQTQSNFLELLLFSFCGLGFGILFSIIKAKKNCLYNGVFFFVFALAIVAVSTQIPFYQMGYQTFLVPLSTFFIAKSALE